MTSTSPLRDQTRRFLAHPYTDVAVVVLVLLSVALVVAEIVLPRRHDAYEAITWAGDGLTALFIVELSLRWWVARSKRGFFRRYWIDILSVLPVVRAARAFRLLRVLRLFRAGVLMNRRLLWHSRSGVDGVQQLSILAALTVAMVFMGMSALHFLEPGVLRHYDDALWFSLYMFVAGEPFDAVPTTFGGKVVTLGLMFGGLTVFGVFVGTVSAWMSARMLRGWVMDEADYQELAGHVILCGWNRSGPTLLREMFHDADPATCVVLVTEGPRPDDLPLELLDPHRFFHHQGDWTRMDVLRTINVMAASKAVLLTDATLPRSDQDRDARTVLAALTIEKLCPDIYTIAEVTSEDVVAHLEQADVEEVVVGDWYAGVILGSAVRNRGIVQVLDEVLSHVDGNAFHTLEVPAVWVGRSVRELRSHLHDACDATLVSLHSGRETFVNPDSGHALKAGDQAVVLARKRPKI